MRIFYVGHGSPPGYFYHKLNFGGCQPDDFPEPAYYEVYKDVSAKLGFIGVFRNMSVSSNVCLILVPGVLSEGKNTVLAQLRAAFLPPDTP